MIKNTVKPCLEAPGKNKYASVQTIAYSPKDVNVVFCSIFMVMRDRVFSVLKKKFNIYTGMSNDEMEEKINKRIDLDFLKTLNVIENDMSKYDKAQELALLRFECMLYEALGMPDWLVDIWYNSHAESIVVDRVNGLRMETKYQRKSGDASTFFGNTMVLLAVITAVYDHRNIEFGMFAGDDSVLWLRSCNCEYDPSRAIADLFNLESKLLRTYNVPYFCSKFVCLTENRLVLVPDLLKVITKLGRRDMTS